MQAPLNHHLQIMKIRRISSLVLVLTFIFFCSATSCFGHRHFLECLSQKSHNYSSFSNVVYTSRNSSYISVLQFSIRNLRFMSESTFKPQLIITPKHESQIPPIIHCAKKTNLEIRTRSGGHDFEGLSYVAQVPFLIIDLINLSEITVDAAQKTAWVQAGATVGSLYYKIAEKSPVLGFPAGSCLTVGVGGQFSGGGYGTLLRKHGLAADQIVDARIVDVRGRILDRKSMGEDLFWAIRGGGGASFGVIVAWKVQLVDVPERVTVFSVIRPLEQNSTELIHRWQYVAPQADKDLYIAAFLFRVNSTIQSRFISIFLGGTDRLLTVMQETFPELGLTREDCTEMSWIQATLFLNQGQQEPLEVLLNRTQPGVIQYKTRSDYVQTPMPEDGFDGIVRMLYEPEADETLIYMVPYGGRMDEIPESDTPFPHRAGNLYMIASLVYWQDSEAQDTDRYLSWSRRYYSYMTPYVSNSPRQAYLNYRDLEIGVNNPDGETSIARASIWGRKYFKNNFGRLVKVKTLIDPTNFFKNEQSIPPLRSN